MNAVVDLLFILSLVVPPAIVVAGAAVLAFGRLSVYWRSHADARGAIAGRRALARHH